MNWKRLFVYAVLGVGTTVHGQEQRTAMNPYRDLTDELARVIQSQIETKSIPAVSIALVDDQEVVWATGFGLERKDPQRRADENTLYRVGSVSKLFTDLAVLQLVEEGRLDLDASVSTYLPEFQPQNPFDRKITLRQLMSHRSGLVRESPIGNYFDPEEPSLEQTVKSLNSTALIYEPESRTKYSNAGIAVVGLTLEKMGKKRFADEIRNRVLTPLGMDQSSFELTPEVRSRLAQAEMWTHDGRTFEAPVFELGTSPAGNLYASVSDVAKFAQAVFNNGQGQVGPIISPETLKSMLDPQFAGDRKGNFGLGFSLSELDGREMVGHGGAVYGYSTQFQLLTREKLGVVIVASKDGANGILKEIAEFALRNMLAIQQGNELETYPILTEIPVTRAKQLDGRFREVDGERTIELIERNGKLLMHRGSYKMWLKMRGDELVTDDLHAQGVTLHLNSVDEFSIDGKTYRRMEKVKPAAMPEQFKGLVGEYGWDHNELFIYERDGVLHCLIEWFYHYPLKQVSRDKFAFPDYGLYHGEHLVFNLDAQGVARDVVAAEVKFDRRETGTKNGETFKINPIRTIEEVQKTALESQPPVENRDFRDSQLVELNSLAPNLMLDIRYATNNNFMGETFYQQPRAFMQRDAAEALANVQKSMNKLGYSLLIHDAYRPWYVTKMFWEATPDDMKLFVANPQNGSRHNRGCAVDLSLADLKTGTPIDMGAGYDEFSTRSFPDYPVASGTQRWHRELLRDAMESAGFTIYEFEWWHFDYGEWTHYPILNISFENIESN
jgi:CubicO group peptidase (beta-lactamase class C family)/D-alanyl-D-alanine dipeptidase